MLKLKYIFLSLTIICNFSIASEVINENNQKVNISSTQQSINLLTNTITFTDHVCITQGLITINADRAIITSQNHNNKYDIIEGFGNPITFFQLYKNEKSISGHALKIRYEILNDVIILTGKVYIKKLNSYICGDKITFLVKKKKIEVISDKNNKVTMVLTLPIQLNTNNNTVDLQEKR